MKERCLLFLIVISFLCVPFLWGNSWNDKKDEHFIIEYSSPIESEWAGKVLREAERYYDTIGKQIGEVLRRHKGLRGQALTDRIIELLDAVEIPDAKRRIGEFPHQFSGGMKQRVMIAIASYVATVEDLLVARQLVDRQFFQTLTDPVLGDVVHPGAPFRMADEEWRLLPPPRLGEHNQKILGGRLGYSSEEISHVS